MHSFKEFIQLNEDLGFVKLLRSIGDYLKPTKRPGVITVDVPKPGIRPGGQSQGGVAFDVDPFEKVDAILDHLDVLADGVYDNLGSLFSDFFEMLGEGYTGAFDAFRMILRNLIADPDLLTPGSADGMLDYLFDMDMVISVSEDGTQMFFSHNGATAAQNEVIDTFFNGALASVDGLFEALVDAFPDSLYGG